MGLFSKKETTEKRDMTIENCGLAADIMYAKLYGNSVDCDLAMQIPSVVTPLRANIKQIQIMTYYPLTKRAKHDIINL